MWEYLDRPLAIVLMVVIPLAWGLGVEYVFELWRRRRARRRSGSAEGA